MNGTRQARPPFVTSLAGRGLKTVEASSFDPTKEFTLRIDDLRNPEDWTTVTIDLDRLLAWLDHMATWGE